jgi:predicted nucleotidyltransferase
VDQRSVQLAPETVLFRKILEVGSRAAQHIELHAVPRDEFDRLRTWVDRDAAIVSASSYTRLVDPLEERIRVRRGRENALATERLAKLPRAVALLRRLGVERIWLFGSLATGATHEDSDVDLMVKGLPSAERTKAWLDLEELFETSVDLVPEEVASGTFREAAQRGRREITSLGREHVAE